jgi:hypothetical protein
MEGVAVHLVRCKFEAARLTCQAAAPSPAAAILAAVVAFEEHAAALDERRAVAEKMQLEGARAPAGGDPHRAFRAACGAYMALRLDVLHVFRRFGVDVVPLDGLAPPCDASACSVSTPFVAVEQVSWASFDAVAAVADARSAGLPVGAPMSFTAVTGKDDGETATLRLVLRRLHMNALTTLAVLDAIQGATDALHRTRDPWACVGAISRGRAALTAFCRDSAALSPERPAPRAAHATAFEAERDFVRCRLLGIAHRWLWALWGRAALLFGNVLQPDDDALMEPHVAPTMPSSSAGATRSGVDLHTSGRGSTLSYQQGRSRSTLDDQSTGTDPLPAPRRFGKIRAIFARAVSAVKNVKAIDGDGEFDGEGTDSEGSSRSSTPGVSPYDPGASRGSTPGPPRSSSVRVGPSVRDCYFSRVLAPELRRSGCKALADAVVAVLGVAEKNRNFVPDTTQLALLFDRNDACAPPAGHARRAGPARAHWDGCEQRLATAAPALCAEPDDANAQPAQGCGRWVVGTQLPDDGFPVGFAIDGDAPVPMPPSADITASKYGVFDQSRSTAVMNDIVTQRPAVVFTEHSAAASGRVLVGLTLHVAEALPAERRQAVADGVERVVRQRLAVLLVEWSMAPGVVADLGRIAEDLHASMASASTASRGKKSSFLSAFRRK